MEKQIKVPIGNKKYAYGILRGLPKNPLIIFVHGIGAFKNEHKYFNGARFFEKYGFSSFRFDLYNWHKDARKLQETKLTDHAQDLDAVIQYFRDKGYKKIHVVGHSFGGPAIFLSKNKDFESVVLWDPSIETAHLEKELENMKGSDIYYANWGLAVIIGREMIEESKRINPLKLVRKLRKPIKFIFAGKGDLKEKDWKKYYEAANEPKDIKIIPNATHNFDEDGVDIKLFQETYSWLKRFA